MISVIVSDCFLNSFLAGDVGLIRFPILRQLVMLTGESALHIGKGIIDTNEIAPCVLAQLHAMGHFSLERQNVLLAEASSVSDI